jgi:hypothetical protein
MGLFDSIQKLALIPAAGVGNLIGSGLNVVSNAVGGNDIFKAQNVSALQSTTFGKVLGTATAATGAALAGAAIGIGTIGSAIAKNPVKSAAVGLIAPAVITAVAEKPQALVNVPAEAASYSSDVGALIANPSLAGATALFKEHTAAVGITAAAAALVVGKAVIPAIATYQNTQAEKANTAAMSNSGMQVIGAAPLESTGVGSDGTLKTDTSQIVTPATESISTKKRSRKAKVKTSSSIRQSVRVNILNNNSANRKTVTYLNRIPLYN